MADSKISNLNAITTPLSGSELIPIVQSGETKKGNVSDLFEYRDTNIAIVSNIATTYGVDWSASDHWDLTMTANTTITESNIPISGKVKTITIELKGNFSPTLPVAWGILGTYDGVNGSQLVIQSWNNGSYRAVINDVV